MNTQDIMETTASSVQGRLRVGFQVGAEQHESLAVLVDEAAELPPCSCCSSSSPSRCNATVSVHVCTVRQRHDFRRQCRQSRDDNDVTTCRLRSKSAALNSGKCVVFNERLSIDLTSVEPNSRLSLSVWTTCERLGESKKLGCMSFGVRSLRRKAGRCKKMAGVWYCLLSDAVGNRKHMYAASDDAHRDHVTQHQHAIHADCATSGLATDRRPDIPSIPSKLLPGHSLTVVLCRADCDSYGFTLRGSCPAVVGSVKAESPADVAGLRSGDCIERVNGRNVSRSTAESIAQTVRCCDDVIVLDINRLPTSSTTECSRCDDITCGRRRSCDDDSRQRQPEANVGSVGKPEEVIYAEIPETAKRGTIRRCTPDAATSDRKRVKKGESLLTMTSSSIVSGDENAAPNVLDTGFVLRDSSKSAMMTSRVTWDPSISVIAHIFSPSAALLRDVIAADCNCPTPIRPSTNSCDVQFGARIPLPVSSKSFEYDLDDCCDEESYGFVLPVSAERTCAAQSRLVPDWPVIESTSLAVRQMALCERRYVDDVSDGVLRLSRPLRHRILSREQHSTLFQNIEKLLVTSEFNERRLNDVIAERSPAGNMAELYTTHLVDAYRQYTTGLRAARRLLAELRDNRQFVTFLKSADQTTHTFDKFLCRPLQHVRDMHHRLTALLQSSGAHQQGEHLLRVVADLEEILSSCRATCRRQSTSNKRRLCTPAARHRLPEITSHN